MRAFIAAVVVAALLGGVTYYVLQTVQEPSYVAYSTQSVRIEPHEGSEGRTE